VADVAGKSVRTRFLVINRLRLRFYEDRRPLQLSVQAGGPFVLVREAGAKEREVSRYSVVDGVMHAE
jgi:hypothetical protein